MFLGLYFFERVFCFNIFVMMLAIQLGCSAAKANGDACNWREDVTKKLGGDYVEIPNVDGTKILCTQRAVELSKVCKYVVVQQSNCAIILEGKYINGHVKWHSATAIEVLSTPGTITDTQTARDFTRVIELSN
jgi:predicted secreted protein